MGHKANLLEGWPPGGWFWNRSKVKRIPVEDDQRIL
jgi:hypothetical protein